MPGNETPDGEFTRYRIQIQRGDGPDRRGKVEVEIQREVDPDGTTKTATLPNGEKAEYDSQNSAFAEFYYESERAVTLLEDRLGLSEMGDE